MVTKLHCRCGVGHGSGGRDGSTLLTRSGSTLLTTRSGLGLGLFLFAVILAACASVVPDRLRDQARSVPFAALQRAPERYTGTLLLLGGEVLALRPRGEWTEVAVLERPLGFRDRPRLDRTPRGRFAVVVRLDEGVDQLGPGRLITVVGEVQGRAGPFDTIPDQSPPAVSHVEPLLMARYLHVWPPPLFPGGPNIGVEFGYQGSIGF